jgi:putative ABC transport system permease protein
MSLSSAIFEAIASLAANKMRSTLTILGIVIGVAAVIAMLAVGAGAQETINSQISGIGTNLLFVFRGNLTETVRNAKPLTLGDAEALRDKFQAPSLKEVAPGIQGELSVEYSGKSTTATIYGVTPEYESVRNYSMLEGEFFSEVQMLENASVALIGVETADKLMGRREGLLGLTVRIENQPFRIIGVLGPKGGGAFGSQDNVLLVPLSTAHARLIRRSTRDRVDVIFIQATSAETVQSAVQEISQILRVRHRSAIGLDDFTVLSQQDFLTTASTITNVLTIFLGGIAGISLLVGGIGIMNIMLVSVTERTREIGLRKALGARRRDILVQFLTESSLLAFVGGVIGIALGYLIGYVVGQIAAANNTDLTPMVSLDAILLATLFSTAVGLFFGIYPANRAANLQPVEALRFE